jgi:hypothetical protein
MAVRAFVYVEIKNLGLDITYKMRVQIRIQEGKKDAQRFDKYVFVSELKKKKNFVNQNPGSRT